MNTKLTVRVFYPCYICYSPYAECPLALDHISAIHGQNLPKGHTVRIRPKNEKYNYAGVNETNWEIHYGCYSCWFHTKRFKKLQEHVKNEHVPNEKNNKRNSKTIAQKLIGWIGRKV